MKTKEALKKIFLNKHRNMKTMIKLVSAMLLLGLVIVADMAIDHLNVNGEDTWKIIFFMYALIQLDKALK